MAGDKSQHSGCREPIAIIGTGLRFPGSSNTPSALWELLIKPRDLLTQIPRDRFESTAFYHPYPDHHGSTNIRKSYFLEEDIRKFDANFFNIKPKEAHAMDPQQRILLEVVYEAIEAAGMSINSMTGSQTGVFVGLMCSDYTDNLRRDINSMPTYTATGTHRSMISNRISYFFDWHGPSMTIDTACSSSLVAVHQAVQLLRSGDSDIAVAAGANLLLEPMQFMEFSKLRMLSPESRCNMWDENAAGYARGEGVAAIVLKRLSTAIADGDHIECVIRESGVNQDGRTKGITMPSSIAQSDLIARTYARAGLDPRNPQDRCQYFEAHGTGTQAGDPREAEAIQSSFFEAENPDVGQLCHPLYVGSVKTVFGHTEGTAGLAGLIKTSLALQHGVIPPNYGFKRLSTAVKPFSTNLKIVESVQAWPDLPEGTPRRASVNSFGFGGTNAHVILEKSCTSSTADQQRHSESYRQLTPLIFSASSESTLRTYLSKYLSHLQSKPGLSLKDLSHTLHTRRSHHAFRISISAKSTADLTKKMESILTNDIGSVGIQSNVLPDAPRILGVFTGQGAQWAQMGKELIMNIPKLQKTIQDMDVVLQSLLPSERPSWSLLEELLRDEKTSRISTAMIGQPLCTMVQLILCDLLKDAGINFKAVVGHSGGEVAAAYAAGIINREDALKVAYFRGLITDRNPPIQRGGMMAIGASPNEAYELCTILAGRVEVAAINSPSSITIAGDVDAINEAKEKLDTDKKFVRILKVDKAYHSQHIAPAGKKYAEALKSTGIRVQTPRKNCPVWFSSVFENRIMGADDDVTAQYWTDNMIRPVLFSHALECATMYTDFDLAIEVGPHPTLKGPTLQTLPTNLLYTGVLSRHRDDIETFSECLGYLWSHVSPSLIEFGQCDDLISGPSTKRLVTDLPRYPWDHRTAFWHSSRVSKAFLNPGYTPNALTGSRSPDMVDGEMRWRNLLLLEELPWIRDHKLQGQFVFPASAYLSTAIEAALQLVQSNEHITMIEVEDIAIRKPLIFKDGDNGIETLFTFHDIVHDKGNGVYTAFFRHNAVSSNESCEFFNHASGRVIVTIGEESALSLPQFIVSPPNAVNVHEEHFYASLARQGYEYGDTFRSVSSIRRKMDFASTMISVPAQEAEHDSMLLHPGLLESALQGMLLAYSHPNDGSIDALYILNSVKTFRVNVPFCNRGLLPGFDLLTSTHLTTKSCAGKKLNGDIDIWSVDGTGIIQFEGVQLIPLVGLSPRDDRLLFTEQQWHLASPDAKLAMEGAQATTEEEDLAIAVERICLHYMKQILNEFPTLTRQALNLPWHFACLFDFFSHIVDTTRDGSRRWVNQDWYEDTEEMISVLKKRYADRVDVRLASAVGNNLSSVLRGNSTMLEHMTKENLLDHFYVEGLGMREYSTYLARIVKQLVHRYANMNILEIGAGTGGATKLIMKEIGHTFSSYTYTDISTGFFETAQQVFAFAADKIVFKTLNVEKETVSQGFQEHAYDLVVASLVLHATADLNRTLSHVRNLLRPGGYLVMTEISDNDVSRFGFMMCAMQGWWLGKDEGRTLSPCISTTEWHELLLQNGFNGVESVTPTIPGMSFPLAVIVSRAIDESMGPMMQSTSRQSLQAVANDRCHILLIGGQKTAMASQLKDLIRTFEEFDIPFTTLRSLAEIKRARITGPSFALLLEDDVRFVPEELLQASIHGLEQLYSSQKAILRVSSLKRHEDGVDNSSLDLDQDMIPPDNNNNCMFQHLRIHAGVHSIAHHLLEALLCLYHRTNMGKTDVAPGMLWSDEPEVILKSDQMLVPRVHNSSELNNRFNATRRAIWKHADPHKIPVKLVSGPGSTYNFSVDSAVTPLRTSVEWLEASNSVCINVSHAIFDSVSGVTAQSHLIIGTDIVTNFTTAAISTSNASRVVVHKDGTARVNQLSRADRSRFLTRLYDQMLIATVFTNCKESSILLLHEPREDLATCITERAARTNVLAFFTTSSSLPKEDKQWIRLSAYSSKRQLIASLPTNISAFIDCSTSVTTKKIGSLIASCLPETCFKANRTELGVMNHMLLGSAASFADSCQKALEQVMRCSEILPIITDINGMAGKSMSNYDLPVILDWDSCSIASIPVLPIQNKIRFKDDRTYALFHFSSQFGQSLCQWMFEHGARNLVVTSEDHFDSKWLHSIESSGLKLRVLEDDVADKKALESLLRNLEKNWPPIAGVAYGGAFAQQELAHSEMSVKRNSETLRKAFQGSRNLHESFRHSTAGLDFFVLFSSLCLGVTQSKRPIISTAGTFMATLVRQRREEGLAASVLHFGDVMGLNGVDLHRSTQQIRAGQSTAHSISERDFHVCFAEATELSQPRRGFDFEIIAGLPYQTEENDLIRIKDPRFQHIVQKSKSIINPKEAQPKGLSIRSRLLGAQTSDDVLVVVTDAFFTKLKACLQLSPDHDKTQILSLGADELGIDSLVAVEICSWLLREFEADVSVFTILAGDKITKLVEDIVLDIPSRLIPKVLRATIDSRGEFQKESVVEACNTSSTGRRSVTVSVLSTTGPSDQSDEQDKETNTSESENSFQKD